MINKYPLKIGWLYPDLMSTYGDRGNIICLQRRCEWRGIEVQVKAISQTSLANELHKCDLLFMGGAQDRQQKIAADDLYYYKGPIIKKMVENGVPGLFICGAYQFLGNYYQPAEGEKILGLGIFDLYTEHSGFDKKRLVGNIVIKLNKNYNNYNDYNSLVGFENHGGRTYLGELGGVGALGEVRVGYGNNGEDKTEGCVYKNAIGTYLHGPVLPKNPHLADWLIKKALDRKYQKSVELEPLDDRLEWQAHNFLLKKLTG